MVKRNPLMKRIPREIKGDWRKYLVISLFLILTIGFVSGMYVANGSMLKAAHESVTKYNLEDGHFVLANKATSDQISQFEENKVKIYENFFRNEDEDIDGGGKSDGTIRVYKKTQNINLACIMDGRLPKAEDEIAIDRMHADNVGLKTGDEIKVSGKKFKIVGLIAYVSYSTLHEKTTDVIFDALKFDVAMVTSRGFDRLSSDVNYGYAWKYNESVKDDSEKKSKANDFLEKTAPEIVMQGNEIKEFVPEYSNPAVNFATDDMGSDKAMGSVIMDVLIVIIAFIFAITISNTISRESITIGTLRASGYTRRELTIHYVITPAIVTLIAAIIGNILGYTFFKDVVVSMYYNSYSLPTYKTVWSAEALWKTTIVPLVLMIAVNVFVVVRVMRYTPLQFLRHDLRKNSKRKSLKLPQWRFITRFRIRIILQNIYGYIILFLGVAFIMVMLAMAVGMPSTLDYYKENTADMMFAQHQYVLKTCQDESGDFVSTSNPDAEKFSMRSLERKGNTLDEEVSVYGVEDDSKYVEISDLESLSEKEVYISQPFAKKYNISTGDTIVLDEKYDKQRYKFKVAGIYGKCPSIAVFMPIENFRKAFDLTAKSFSGFMSDSKITDIDKGLIATEITKHDITKMCDQLDHSMGNYMKYFQILCIMLAAALIYLLTKLIIERNEKTISMVKVLGFDNGEIARLYIVATSIVLIVADAVSVFIGAAAMKSVWKVMMASYSGYFEFVMNPMDYVKMFLFVLAGYLFVTVLDFRRIEKIPMEGALKNME